MPLRRARKRSLLALLAARVAADRVLSTAPAAYAERLAPKIEARCPGVACVRGPAIETVALEDESDLETALRSDVAIVAFTSRRGIEAALRVAPDRLRSGGRVETGRRVAAAPRLRRGYFSDESRRRRGCDVDIPWRRVAAAALVTERRRLDADHRVAGAAATRLDANNRVADAAATRCDARIAGRAILW